MPDDPVTLTLSAATINTYCHDLVRRLPSIERRIAAIDALRTFLAVQIATAQQAGPGYAAIRETLEHHFEQARSELQRRQLGQLVEGLGRQRLASIGRLYQALSRDAFWQLMEEARLALGSEASDAVAVWATEWLHDVEARSAQLSPYPDAIDFMALGIEVGDYTMMYDIARCFATNPQP